MEKTENRIEKRKLKRFEVKDGAYSVISFNPTIMAEIVNLSMEGLAVLYKGKRLKASTEVDLFISDAGFYLEQLPVKTVTDHKKAGSFPFSSKTVWQRCIQFGELTDDQKSELKNFLHHYTSMANRSDKDRRDARKPRYSGPERRSGVDRRNASA